MVSVLNPFDTKPIQGRRIVPIQGENKIRLVISKQVYREDGVPP